MEFFACSLFILEILGIKSHFVYEYGNNQLEFSFSSIFVPKILGMKPHFVNVYGNKHIFFINCKTTENCYPKNFVAGRRWILALIFLFQTHRITFVAFEILFLFMSFSSKNLKFVGLLCHI